MSKKDRNNRHEKKRKNMDEQNINQSGVAENTAPSNVTPPTDEQNAEAVNTEVVEADNKQSEAIAEKETPAEPVSEKKAEDEQESKTAEVKDNGSRDSDKKKETKSDKNDSFISGLEKEVLSFIIKVLEVISKFEKYIQDAKENTTELENLRKDLKAVSKEKEKLEGQINEKNTKIDTLNKQISDNESKHKDALKKKEDEVSSRYEGQIKDRNSKIDSLNKQISDNEAKHKDALKKKEDEVTSKYEGQIKERNSKIDSLNKQISDLKSQHKDELVKQEKEITAKFEEQLRHYNNTVKIVPFAENYAKKLNELLEIGNKIKADSAKLTTKRMEDPYNVYKCISKCWTSLASIDMEKFDTEVSLISNAKLVVKGKSGLDKYNDNTSELEVRTYFFDAYLKKYIDAIVTLNENCAGIHRLVEGLEESDTKSFLSYRQNLENVCNNLGIIVETVHLFDKAGVNSALKATPVDAGCGTDEIVEIGNSIVYMTGANRPSDKIEVKVQG